MSDTLVLNRNFCAVHITGWQRAVSLLYQGHAEVLDDELCPHDFNDWSELSALMTTNDKGFVHSATMRIAVPEVIRLTRYDKLPRREVKFSRSNIFEHYKNKCCYCGRQFPTRELNLDHVVPRSKGGLTNWNNIVTSCIGCNTIKDDRILSEASYPGSCRLKEMGLEYLKPLAGKPMRLLVRPSRPKWQGSKTIVVNAPLPIPISWQTLLDKKYWEEELEHE